MCVLYAQCRFKIALSVSKILNIGLKLLKVYVICHIQVLNCLMYYKYAPFYFKYGLSDLHTRHLQNTQGIYKIAQGIYRMHKTSTKLHEASTKYTGHLQNTQNIYKTARGYFGIYLLSPNLH